MFQTEDLPLFSGTSQTTRENGFEKKPVTIQKRLLACPICLGTGAYLNSKTLTFCTCEVGQKAKGTSREI